MPHLLVVVLAALFTSVAVGYDVRNNFGSPYSPQCFTCPQVSYFKTGFLHYENPGYVEFSDHDNAFICSYMMAGYDYDSGNQRKHQAAQFIGRCHYDANGHQSSGSDYECWKHAAIDEGCAAIQAHNKDKGTYLKKCAQEGCWYETDACNTCPKVKSDRVEIDTRDKKLECKYYTGNSLNDHCRYDASSGTLTSSQGGKNAPSQCPKKASQDTPCLVKLREKQKWEDALALDRKADEAKKKKAAEREKFLKESGLWDVGCMVVMKGLLSEQIGSLIKERDPAEICRWKPEELLKELKRVRDQWQRIGFRKEGLKALNEYVDSLEDIIKKTS